MLALTQIVNILTARNTVIDIKILKTHPKLLNSIM